MLTAVGSMPLKPAYIGRPNSKSLLGKPIRIGYVDSTPIDAIITEVGNSYTDIRYFDPESGIEQRLHSKEQIIALGKFVDLKF